MEEVLQEGFEVLVEGDGDAVRVVETGVSRCVSSWCVPRTRGLGSGPPRELPEKRIWRPHPPPARTLALKVDDCPSSGRGATL